MEKLQELMSLIKFHRCYLYRNYAFYVRNLIYKRIIIDKNIIYSLNLKPFAFVYKLNESFDPSVYEFDKRIRLLQKNELFYLYLDKRSVQYLLKLKYEKFNFNSLIPFANKLHAKIFYNYEYNIFKVSNSKLKIWFAPVKIEKINNSEFVKVIT